ncbi:MAG: gfo/Idh/MocA family oxidoreductase [Candidatus Hydrogenedens sp.]|nr:gfo/Idh/MocA family oxidoreductase [Candidatus Hydrogenedens sp.]
MTMSRRTFMGASAGAILTAGTFAQGSAFGANGRINMAVIGVRGRGGSHIDGWLESPDSELVALCDADEHFLEARAREVEKRTGKKVKTFTDMRELFEDKEIDAVSIATPNHWHALAAIWAVQAGKDVYVEKPGTHNYFEGLQLMAAAEKYDRIIQHGTQRRSEANWMRDIALIQSGEIIGDVYMARGLCYKNGNRGDIGTAPNEEPPAHLHWRLWQGPASEQEYNRLYHPYTWHWFWHYGNGEIGNQGVHQMDVAVWGMNKGMPVSVYSAGGRYTYEDQAQTPNTNVATFTYEDGKMLVFEVRNRWTNDESGVSVGNLFYANEGYYVEGKGFFDTKDQPIKIDNDKYPYPESHGNWQNFLNAVKARDKSMIHGNMKDAHLSAAHCHLANTSYRLGRSLEFDPAAGQYKGDDEANKMLTRDYHPDFTVPKLA